MDAFETVGQDGSDILFSMHDYEPPQSPVNNSSQTGLSGAQIIQQVLHSPRIKHVVTEIAHKQNVSVDVIFKEARKILEDIGHTFTLKSIRFMGFILRKVFRNIYAGIKVNVAGLKKVKELSKEFPVVLVPSHRSYTDFLLVSFVCFIFQVPLPVIAAAQDFKNMKFIGGLLRNCGAFYMKRSFRSDELYWAVFSEYVQSLMLNSGTTMEFFLEGTRSRSGKSLHPKQGLLSILTDLYFTSRVPDVMFCPVSISYERVLEEALLARELMGVPKPKESLKGLLSSRSVLSDNYGYVYLYFGKPISLRDFVGGEVARAGKACIPRSIKSDPSQEEMVVVRKLANHVLRRLQDHLVILPNMVVASVLLQNPRGISLEILIEQYGVLCGWFATCNIPVIGKDHQDYRSAVMESLQLLKSSLTTSEDGYVSLLDPEVFSMDFKSKIYNILMGKHLQNRAVKNTTCGKDSSSIENIVGREHDADFNGQIHGNMKDKSVECEVNTLRTQDKDYLVYVTCVHLQLAHQRNQLLHWFYVPAMVVLTQNNKSQIHEEKLYNDAKFLGDLLCVEVARDMFPSKEDFLAQLETFKGLGISVSTDGFYDIEMTDALSFILNLWSPLVTSYWVVYTYIVESCAEGTEYVPDALVHNCQDFGLSLFLKGIVNYLEIQSLELLRNGLKSLQKLNIIQQLKHHSEKPIVVLNKTALYNLAVTIEHFLELSYNHTSFLMSKL